MNKPDPTDCPETNEGECNHGAPLGHCQAVETLCWECNFALADFEDRFCEDCANELDKENDPDFDPFRSGFEQ
jgi:predicted amidophosphoribosyltransferase